MRGVPKRGRPPLTPEQVEARIRDYCARYAVAPNADGLPPFPTGHRETAQHREWLTVYKAHQRLRRRVAAGGDEGAPPAAASS